MKYPTYLMHFNRNHSRKDGKFVRGDGDGDGNPNDHKVYDVGNGKYVDEYGHPLKTTEAIKRKIASRTVSGKSSSSSTSKSENSDSNTKNDNSSTKTVTVGTDQSSAKAEVTVKNDTQDQKTSNASVTKYGGNINADGSMVRISSDGKVQLANVGGVKSIMKLMTDDFAERKKAKEEEERKKKEAEEAKRLAEAEKNKTVSSVSKSSVSSGKSYVEKTIGTVLTEEEAAAARQKKFEELENRYKPKTDNEWWINKAIKSTASSNSKKTYQKTETGKTTTKTTTKKTYQKK